MTAKTKGSNAPEAVAPAIEKNELSVSKPATESPLQKRLQFFAGLNSKVKTRKILAEHLDVLKGFPEPEKPEIVDGESEENEGREALQKVTLHYGSGNYERYEIKNAALLQEVKALMIGKLEGRLATLEAEIIAASL